jgi:hypothetical protein
MQPSLEKVVFREGGMKRGRIGATMHSNVSKILRALIRLRGSRLGVTKRSLTVRGVRGDEARGVEGGV